MNIVASTKFDIGENVYYIEEAPVSDNTFFMWDVTRIHGDDTSPKSYPIRKIRVIYYEDNSHSVEYLIQNSWICEENVYKSVEQALVQCKILNRRGNR